MALPFTVGTVIDSAQAGRSNVVGFTTVTTSWIVWTAGLVALLVTVTVSLTTLRLLAPMPGVAAGIAAIAGGPSAPVTAAALIHGAVLFAVIMTAEVGHAFVQGSAYGDERRFPLRPPGPLLLIVPIGWTVAAGLSISGLLLMSAKQWIAGAPIAIAGVVLSLMFARRCHRLARRFAVFVPAGFALHDHLALSETAMFRRHEIATFDLARADTEALDLTAAALGPAIELGLHEMAMVVRAGTFKQRQGTGVHVKSLLFAPSRPGRFLEAAYDRARSAQR